MSITPNTPANRPTHSQELSLNDSTPELSMTRSTPSTTRSTHPPSSFYGIPPTPETPTHPNSSQVKLSNRKSTASSIRRKPIPFQVGDEELVRSNSNTSGSIYSVYEIGENDPFVVTPGMPGMTRTKSAPQLNLVNPRSTSTSSSSVTQAPISTRSSSTRRPATAGDAITHEPLPPTPITPSKPPQYVLSIAQPLPALPQSSSTSSSNTATPNSYYTPQVQPQPSFGFEIEATGRSSFCVDEEALPRYAEESATEPKTLAKALWKWGFVFPLLWFLGMTILWIPLRPLEEEKDVQEAQKIEEMIAILRKTELKYAKRCAYAFSGFMAFIIAIVIIAVGVSVGRR